MRQLVYFSIVHNQADLGSLKEEISREGEKKYGKEEWENHLKQIKKSWDRVEEIINQYLSTKSISANKIRIYQDGLPAADEIRLKIVRDVAGQGSRNHQILEDLINRGACLEEAESRELLLQEHEYLSRICKATTPIEKLKQYILYQDVSQDLLDKRDEYIAKRINTTLDEGELGFGFFGGTHSITDKLDKDITIIPIHEFNDKISVELINQGLLPVIE